MSRQRVLPSSRSQGQVAPVPQQQGGSPFSNLSTPAPYEQQQPQQWQQQQRDARGQFPPQQQPEHHYDSGAVDPLARESSAKTRSSQGRERERDREQDRGRTVQQARQARAPSTPNFAIDEENILKTYNLSTLQPEHWEDTSIVDDGVAADEPTAGPSGSRTSRLKPNAHDEQDPLGLYRGSVLSNVPELPKEIKAAIFTKQKGFDPKVFLANVHPAATPDDLKYGRDRLKESMESRTGAVQRLVEENFDRFVTIKAATFNVYEEMKLGPLATDGDYSIADLKESLTLAQDKVDAVWNPILEARLKADRLRSTLGVFERSKFFFTLPAVLSESIASGRYDQFLASYKKGKYLLDSRPGALLGLPPGSVMTEAQREKHGRVFEKIWGQIERTRDGFKDLLTEQLRDPRRDVEGVERNVEILLELDPGSDPVWIFFDTQHTSIKQVLERCDRVALAKFQKLAAKAQGMKWDETAAARNLQSCVLALDTPQPDAVIDQAAGHDSWKAVEELVHDLCDAILQTLPSFWKVAKAYLDGKYHRKDGNLNNERLGKGNKRGEHGAGGGRRSPSQVRVMTTEIVNTYIAKLGSFFRLSSDTSSPALPQGASHQPTEADSTLPTFVPQSTNALTAGNHLLKILGELADCTNEIGALSSIGMEIQNSLKEFMGAMRWKFADVICQLWTRDARAFYRLETWKLDSDDPSRTIYLKRITSYQRAVARSCYRASGGTEEAASNLFISGNTAALYSRSMRDQNIPGNFARRIHAAYLDALYLFLDGLVHLAFSQPMLLSEDPQSGPVSATPGSQSANGSLASPGIKDVDYKDRDVRILLAVSNLTHFRTDFIGKIVDQLKTALKVDMSQDTKTLNDVVTQLDKILFEEYINSRSAGLKNTMDSGVLGSGRDWSTAPKPTEVRPYIYDALLSLVLVHSQVTAIAKSLVIRTVGALVEELAKHALQAFKQVSRFGMGGMLQATLEMEFLHQTLNVHVSPTADATLQEIYKIISQAYRPQSGAEGANGELQRELEQLKLTLTQARRATALQFLCFRERRPSMPSQASSESSVGRAASSSGKR